LSVILDPKGFTQVYTSLQVLVLDLAPVPGPVVSHWRHTPLMRDKTTALNSVIKSQVEFKFEFKPSLNSVIKSKLCDQVTG
jgi:hypothetical protein